MSDIISRKKAIDAIDNLCKTVCPYKPEQIPSICTICPLEYGRIEIETLPDEDSEPVEDLKPCPFCGCEDVYVSTNDENSRYGVRCIGCYGKIDESYYDEKSAIDAWNMRAVLEKK